MSNSSREYSPDWLRNFQAPPTESILTLSSSSESIRDNSAVNDDETDDDGLVIKSLIHKTSEVKSPSEKPNVKGSQVKNTKGKNLSKREGSRRDGNLTKRKAPEKPAKPHEPKNSVWTLSSDSEAYPDASPLREEDVHHKELSEQETGQHSKDDKDDAMLDTIAESSLKEASKLKSPKKRLKVDDVVTTKTKGKSQTKQEIGGDMEVAEGETTEKQTGPYVSSSRLPLVLSDKAQRSKALVECEGDSIDLSGDLGSVGRVVISDSPSGNHDMLLDLKGTIYKTTIVPSRTFCVVSFGQSEAKIEAIMNDFIQLKPQSNVYEAETMVEGTLEGFSFDSEDEADNPTTRQTDENEGTEQQKTGKGRGKTEKASGEAKKKAKTATKKPIKKIKRKAPVSKKTKTKK